MTEVHSSITTHDPGPWLSPGGILVGFLAFFGYLPAIIGSVAALAAAAYYITQTMQNPDVRRWINERRERKRAKQVQVLQYQQSVIIGKLKNLGVLTHAEVRVDTDKQVLKIASTPDAPAKSN